MRTTVDIPDALGKRMKLVAVRRGMTVKDLIVAALDRELDARAPAHRSQELTFPLVPSETPGRLDLSPEEIHEILVRQECAAHDAADRS